MGWRARRTRITAAMGTTLIPMLGGTALAALTLVGSGTPALALVPYVYVPRAQELEGAGLGIAQAASRLLRLGQAADAARLAALTVQLLPDDPRGWLLLAEAQLRSNQNKQAALALTRAKQLDPRNAGIWFAEGSLALRNGNPKLAVETLQEGLRLDNRNAGAYFDLGNAHLLLGNPRAALGDFERAAGLRSGFWEAINNQALVLYEQGARSAAITRWRAALKIKPDAAEPTLALAAGLFGKGSEHRQEAMELASRALDGEPNYVLESYQKEQLWGPQLRVVTQQLLGLQELKAAVERAHANAAPEGNPGEDL